MASKKGKHAEAKEMYKKAFEKRGFWDHSVRDNPLSIVLIIINFRLSFLKFCRTTIAFSFCITYIM